MAVNLESLALSHYGNWIGVITWIVLFSSFLIFLPFNQKSNFKPTNTFFAFVIASAFEMFGIPLSMYFLTWAFGVNVPVGILWGHTLENIIGYWSMYIGMLFNIIGGYLIFSGWKVIYRKYWSKEDNEGQLVTDGIYAYMRHPQYTGFILMTFGLLIHWATLPLLVMWPLLVRQYYKLARMEEQEMTTKFRNQYLEYMKKVPMFLPIARVRAT